MKKSLVALSLLAVIVAPTQAFAAQSANSRPTVHGQVAAQTKQSFKTLAGDEAAIHSAAKAQRDAAKAAVKSDAQLAGQETAAATRSAGLATGAGLINLGNQLQKTCATPAQVPAAPAAAAPVAAAQATAMAVPVTKVEHVKGYTTRSGRHVNGYTRHVSAHK